MDEVTKVLKTNASEPKVNRTWKFALCFVALAATSVVAPMFVLSNASGHDYMFHLASWMDAASQWREGIFYPRWAEWANWGFGEPRFIFYPPASWMMGAALGSLLPWRVVPGTFIWLTLIASGMSMWKLARDWLPGSQAATAAVLYTISPYLLITAYYRSDFAELLALALFPLLIKGAVNAAVHGWRYVPPLAVAFAGIWLSNAPAAVIATYALSLAIGVQFLVRRDINIVLKGAVAMAAGFGVAAFYILPAAWERRWVQIGEAVSGDMTPARSFLFTQGNDPEFVIFNWKVSWIALGMILLTAIAGVILSRKSREFRELWWVLIVLGAVSVAMMWSPSKLLWRLPELRFVQFPWRWLGILDVVFAFFLAAGVSRRFHKRRLSWAIVGIVFAILFTTGTAIVQDAWWDDQGVPMLADAIRSAHGYEGTDEYMPLDCDRYELPGNPDDSTRPNDISANPAPRIQTIDPHPGAVPPASTVEAHVELWTAEHRVFTTNASTPATIALQLVNYPSWQAEIDGRPVPAASANMTDQMLVPLPAGAHRVDIHFHRTWDRAAGDAISALSGIALLAGTLLTRKRELSG